jgi:putative methanogenesis marker 16 metalloprotein
MAAVRTIQEINARLAKGEAVVMSAQEFKKEVRGGYHFKLGDVDVVTTATRAVMSGTSATLVLPIEAGSGVRQAWINGVPCAVAGTTESTIEVVVYGTAESRDFPRGYAGGHLFRDLVEGKTVQVECELEDGREVVGSVALSDLPFARLYSFRNGYKNYSAFANVKNRPSYKDHPGSIFACRPLPWLRGVTTSGSGEMNPLENDPAFRVIRPGTRILVNKAPGVVIGSGTRSSAAAPNLSIAADMRGMDPEFMGGFKTSHGAEITNSIAVPHPVLTSEILDDLTRCLDENIPLRIADLADRKPLTEITYADLWKDAPLWVDFQYDRCIVCSTQCPAEYYCPMGAISWRKKQIDQTLCVACGACVNNCPGGAFSGRDREANGRIGEVKAFGQSLPIVFRQSNRRRSEELAEYLKERLLGGTFLLTDVEARLKFGVK